MRGARKLAFSPKHLHPVQVFSRVHEFLFCVLTFSVLSCLIKFFLGSLFCVLGTIFVPSVMLPVLIKIKMQHNLPIRKKDFRKSVKMFPRKDCDSYETIVVHTKSNNLSISSHPLVLAFVLRREFRYMQSITNHWTSEMLFALTILKNQPVDRVYSVIIFALWVDKILY